MSTQKEIKDEVLRDISATIPDLTTEGLEALKKLIEDRKSDLLAIAGLRLAMGAISKDYPLTLQNDQFKQTYDVVTKKYDFIKNYVPQLDILLEKIESQKKQESIPKKKF